MKNWSQSYVTFKQNKSWIFINQCWYTSNHHFCLLNTVKLFNCRDLLIYFGWKVVKASTWHTWRTTACHPKWIIPILYSSKKVGSKFEIYKFLVFSEFKLIATCLFFFWTSSVDIDTAWLKISTYTGGNSEVEAVS